MIRIKLIRDTRIENGHYSRNFYSTAELVKAAPVCFDCYDPDTRGGGSGVYIIYLDIRRKIKQGGV